MGNMEIPCWGCEEYFDLETLESPSEIGGLDNINAKYYCSECRKILYESLTK